MLAPIERIRKRNRLYRSCPRVAIEEAVVNNEAMKLPWALWRFRQTRLRPESSHKSTRPEPLPEEEFKALSEHRSRFITLSADIAKELGKFSVTVALENAKNIRNLLVVAGVLASLGLLLLSSKQFGAGRFLVLAVITYLASIAAGAAYLMWDTSKAARQIQKLKQNNFELPDKGKRIVNNWEDRNISRAEAEKQLAAVYRQMHFEKVRSTETVASRDSYSSQLVHGLFVLATLFLVVELTRLLLVHI